MGELEQALETGDVAFFRAQLDSDPELITRRNEFGDTYLLRALSLGHLPLVRWLLAQGADPNAQGDDGYTCLQSALESSHPDALAMVRVLLQCGARVEQPGVNGWSPLHLAAARGSVDAAEVLLAAGAHVDQRATIDGDATPLMEAAAAGEVEMVRWLLARGASRTVRNLITGEDVRALAAHAHRRTGNADYEHILRLLDEADRA